MRQRRRDVLNVTIPTGGALADGIARAGTGGGHGRDLIAVFALGCGGLLHLSAAGAKFQQLAIGFAGSVTDDDALPCVAQRVHIVALFDFAALHTEVAVIAEAGAAGFHAVQQREMMILAAAFIGAAVAAAVLILAAAVRVTAAAGTGAIVIFAYIITQKLLSSYQTGLYLCPVSLVSLKIRLDN